ncbi:MAG: hypothetical protein KAH23_04510 [Kiritimatiellae bacterium]|nr:hypothetical protein [Kiritimatiellia bacterium]
MRQIGQFIALARLTAFEAVRQPICLLLTTTCVLLIAVFPVLNMHTFGEDGKLARDSGLALHFVFGMFVAGYAACSSISKEMRSGTASAVLSKPVSRELFFLAKFAGVAGVVLIFSACATITTLISERIAEKFYTTGGLYGWIQDKQTAFLLIAAPFVAYLIAAFCNYRTRKPFGSMAIGLLLMLLLLVMLISSFFTVEGNVSSFDPFLQWRIVSASILITMALIVLAAIALTISTRFGTVPTLVFCSVVFLLGLMSDFFFGRIASSNGMAAVLYRVLPNWQHFWMSDALSGGGTIPWIYVCHAGLYAVIYLSGILCLGMVSFRYADMK